MSVTPCATTEPALVASSVLASNILPAEISSPLTQLFPYIVPSLSALWRGLVFTISLLRPLLYLSPVPMLAYTLAPLIVFFQIVATIFIISPYRTLIYLLDALFPLYVFCGVACITGGLLGLIARVLCRIVVNVIQVDDGSLELPTPLKDEKIDQSMKGKGRNTDKVKFQT